MITEETKSAVWGKGAKKTGEVPAIEPWIY